MWVWSAYVRHYLNLREEATSCVSSLKERFSNFAFYIKTVKYNFFFKSLSSFFLFSTFFFFLFTIDCLNPLTFL